MNVKDKISDSYLKQVDELIDNQLDHDLFNPLNQEEMDEMWEEISTEMEIGEVWDDISSDLDIVMPVDSGSGIIVKSFTAVLIILIGMIPVKKAILDSDINQQDILIETKQKERSVDPIFKNNHVDSSPGEKVKEDISPASRSSLDKSGESNMPSLAERNRTDLTHGNSIPASIWVIADGLTASGMADSNLVVSPDKIPAEKSKIPQVVFPGGLEKIELLSETDFCRLKINNISSAPRSSLPLSERGKISGGLITMFKNTWLLNNETWDGLKSESLTTTKIVILPDFGLSLNFSLNKNWLLQADGFFFSNTGQEYLGYYHGHYGIKKITLRYSMLALSVKYKFEGREPFMNHSSINLLAGGYLSVLQYANQEKITVLENIGSQYTNFDLGVRVSGEFELQILEQLSIAPGLVLSIGIPNIYKGDGNIPGYLRKTHNGSAGFQLAFYYHFD